MANQPQSAQQQQQAQKQVETALNQYAQAHGLFGGIPWGIIAPLILQLIQAIQSGGGVTAGQQQQQPAQQQPGQQTP